MRVSCNEYLGLRYVDMLQGLGCIVAWVTAYVCHQYFCSLHLEEVELREHTSHHSAVDITVYRLQGFEGGDLICHLYRAEVACVPYLVTGGEELHKYIVKHAVCVGDYTNFHTFFTLFHANIHKNINFYALSIKRVDSLQKIYYLCKVVYIFTMRNIANILMLLMVVLTAGAVSAQQNLWQSGGVVSPEVCKDGSVVFRYYAPLAESVEVVGDFAMGAQMMTKNEQGVWELHTAPLASEYYTYTFVVDGNAGVLDRENVYTVRDVGSVMNYFIVGGGCGDMYKAQAVPHGAVSRVWATTEGAARRMTVYTPAGYEAGYRNYPVLYLLHGMGGDEEAWVATGRVAEIMDNLIAAGRVEPMIVVMPNGCMRHDAAPGYSEEGFYKPYMSGSMDGSFEEYFDGVVEWVDAHYRTYPSKECRAIAGLSMGGFHAMQISKRYPDMFDYVGLFSAAIYRGEEGVAMYENLEEGIAEQFGRGVALYWIGIGKDDFLYEENVRFRAMLDAADYEYEYRESEGGHTWRNWRLYLAEFAERLF